MMTDLGWWRIWRLGLLLTIGGTNAAAAGSVEVVVRDRGGDPVAGEHVFLEVVAADADDWRIELRLRRGYLSALTGLDGKARFDELPAGTYSIGFPRGLRDRTLVRPADNPFVPEARVSLFEDGEHLQVEVELWRGVPITAYLDLPENRYSGFRAVFEHRETGLVLIAGFSEHVNSVERLLVPGVWDIRVDPKPGYLLVGLEQERLPLPGHSARLDLVEEPRETWLTWIYTAPCELFGSVVEATGRAPAVHVEATLVEPGSWIEAARRRGGSNYEEVVAAVDPFSGRYEMVLPDGRWRVRPVGSLLVASDPEHVDLDLAPGAASRADFTIRLDEEADGEALAVAVFDAGSKGVAEATVEVYELEDPGKPLRTGVTDGRGRALLAGVGEGDYLVVAGHPDHLEGSIELVEYDPRQRPLAQVILPAGAEVRVQAFDAGDEPLGEVAVTLERLDEPPSLRLQSADFLAAKTHRILTTDPSGRVSSYGFYPGSYRARAQLSGRDSSRGLIRLTAPGDRAGREIHFDVAGSERIDLEARLQPAASVSATLLCNDAWSLPDTTDVKIVAAGAETGSDEAALALTGVVLAGRGRDTFTAGPLEPGLYLLAVRPGGFDRWTWSFETHDPRDAISFQVDVADGDGIASVDLGLFQIECGPTVDLLPTIAGAGEFPDVEEVKVEVHLLDSEGGAESHLPPTVLRRDGRLQLRDFPRPAPRGAPLLRPPLLEITLVHPHLLPAPVQRWQTELELDRGSFEEIELQVEALGGAVAVEGAGSVARLFGSAEEIREVLLADGKAEIPSLAPGRYSLRIESSSGDLLKEWRDLEVGAGQTLHLKHP